MLNAVCKNTLARCTTTPYSLAKVASLCRDKSLANTLLQAHQAELGIMEVVAKLNDQLCKVIPAKYFFESIRSLYPA